MFFSKEKYTTPVPISFFGNVFHTLNTIIDPSISFILNDINGLPRLSFANSIIDVVNGKLASNVSYYSSESGIDNLELNAYTSGEPVDNIRDRIMLRCLLLPSLMVYTGVSIKSNTVSLNFTSEGVLDFTSNVISSSGKSVKDFLVFVMTLVQMAVKENQIDATDVSYINSFLPSMYTPYVLASDFTEPGSFVALYSSSNPRDIWLTQAILIGCAHIVWISENKWKLDPAWSFPQSPPS